MGLDCRRDQSVSSQNFGASPKHGTHSPVEHLVRALEARRTDPRIVDLARNFQRPVCQELKRRVPRPQVSLEPTRPKWAVVQADNAFWRHPHTLETAQFTLMIDEGCRFRVGKVMVKGDGGISGAQLIRYYQEGWKPVFEKPRNIRVDPAGAWRAMEYMNHAGIEYDNIPAEAHWGISHVERAIDCTKAIMTNWHGGNHDERPKGASRGPQN